VPPVGSHGAVLESGEIGAWEYRLSSVPRLIAGCGPREPSPAHRHQAEADVLGGRCPHRRSSIVAGARRVTRAAGVVAFVEPPEQRVGGAAVLRTVVDSDVVVDVASELPELVLGDTARGMPPLRHGERAGEIDGLGVGHDRCDRVTGREPAGQRVVAEKRVDQRSAPVSVEAVPGPEGGDVGRLGERVGGCLAAVASGQPVVALCSVTTTRRQLVSGTYSSSMCRPRRNSVSRTLRMCVSSSRSVRLNAVSLLRRVPPRSSRGRRGSPGPRMRQRPRCRAAPEHRRRRRRR
jgi:hypothetical protein